jgi:hypothetical protein
MNNQTFCKFNIEDFSEDDLIEMCKSHIPNNDKSVIDQIVREMKREEDDVWKPIVLKYAVALLTIFSSVSSRKMHPVQSLSSLWLSDEVGIFQLIILRVFMHMPCHGISFSPEIICFENGFRLRRSPFPADSSLVTFPQLSQDHA